MKLAAIDIGSNAARLLVSEVTEIENYKPSFTKLNLIRVPIRLGFDVFEKNEISSKRISMLLQTMKAFSYILKIYEVKHLKACATSAMRDARNSPEIIKKVKLETGIKIEIISGDEEAS
ncbi:MAG TPA: exopolyphosphatase, partial [Parafilimonas sp.]|nr:exopolyphosphatase [Parafilimonas sp.]